MRTALAACAVALALGVSQPAEAARLITIETPSRHVDPAQVRFNGADHPRRLRANRVTVRNGAECGFTARLPFELSRPPEVCGTLSVRVHPRRVRLGRATRVRFRVLRRVGALTLPVHGARIRLGRRGARTDRRGRASVRYRPRGRPARTRARVALPGLRTVRPSLRIVR